MEEKIKVIWYCHECGYKWKGVRFRKRYGRGGRRVSRSICPKCGNRMVTPGTENQDWIEIRQAVWKRDKSQCQSCGKHRGKGIWLVVHHMKPVNKGGSSEIDNLILLCKKCHKWEHRILTWVGSGARYSYKDKFKPWGIIRYFALAFIFSLISVAQPFAIIPLFLGLYSLILFIVYRRRLKQALQIGF